MRAVRAVAVAFGGLIIGLAACHPNKNDRVVVRRWLLCEECNRGELDSVVALKDRATGLLRDALRGPPDSGREHVRRQAESRYRRLRTPLTSLQIFVVHYDSNYVANYQTHAAIALARIGTASARAALLQAVQSDSTYAEAVVRALAAAVPLGVRRVTGDSQAAPPDSFLRIKPAVLVRDDSTGQALANVLVAFTVDSGGGRVDTAVRRTGPNGVASVRWSLGPGPDSTNVLRATSYRHSVSFRATAHGPKPRLVFIVQPSNGRKGQPISPAPRVVALDAWDQRDTTLSGTASVRAVKQTLTAVIGMSFTATGSVAAGQVDFPNLIPTFSDTGVQLIVVVTGATRAVSRRFDVAP